MIRKIISGGQTGADQTALHVAIKLGIPHGGWIPKGRITEAGPLSDKYGATFGGSPYALQYVNHWVTFSLFLSDSTTSWQYCLGCKYGVWELENKCR